MHNIRTNMLCRALTLLSLWGSTSSATTPVQQGDWHEALARSIEVAVRVEYTKQYEQAIPTYLSSVEVLRPVAQSDPHAAVGLAEILNYLGYAYTQTGRRKESGAAYLEALAVSRDLVQAHWAGYGPPLESVLRALTGPAFSSLPLAEAEPLLQETIAVFRGLASTFPGRYRPLLALTLELLGNVLAREGAAQSAEAFAAFEEATSILRSLLHEDADPQAKSDLAMILADRGFLHYRLRESEQAERFLVEATSLLRELTVADPEGPAKSQLAVALGRLGLVYTSTQNFERAEGVLLEALALKRSSPSGDSESAPASIAITLDYLAGLYWKQERFEQSERLYREVLVILRPLAARNPTAYEDQFAGELYNFADLLNSLERVDESRSLYEELAPITRRQWERDSTNGDFHAHVLNRLAILQRQSDLARSCALAQEAMIAAKDEKILKEAQEFHLGCINLRDPAPGAPQTSVR